MRVYVGERDPENGTARVWVVQEQPRPDIAEIVELIAEIRSVSSSVPVFDNDEAEERRRADVLARKERLITQIEHAAEAPRPVELECRERDGFGWGGETGGNLLAAAILRCETGEDPPASVHARFRQDVLDPVYDRWELRLPSSQVWTWIEENRELVERELFQQPPLENGASWAVTDFEVEGRDAGVMSDAAASEVVRACEEAWRAIRDQHPDLPDAVMILGSGVERGRLVKLGHWWSGRWIADGALRGEVLLAGEALHLKPDEVFEVLLHEAAHGLNAARGIKDTSRGGRYHNARFASAAREVGLHVETMPPYGLARTLLTPASRETYGASIERLGDVMRIARQIDARTRAGAGHERDGSDGGTERDQDRERAGRVLAECGCGRKMRIAKSVLAAGPIVCGLCSAEFASPGIERAGQQSAVVDRSFLDRRRAELGIGVDAPVAEKPDERQRDQAAVGRWYERFGTYEELPMPASDERQAARRAELARALLAADGTLKGPSTVIGGLDVAAGDRVVATADDPATGLPHGTLGTVAAVDPDERVADIDFATWGRLRVGVEDTVARLLRHDYVEPIASQEAEADRGATELSVVPDGPGGGA